MAAGSVPVAAVISRSPANLSICPVTMCTTRFYNHLPVVTGRARFPFNFYPSRRQPPRGHYKGWGVDMHRVENHDAIKPGGRSRVDRSVMFLLFTNLAIIVWAVLEQWNVSDLLWIYWGQSVIIGWFNVHRIVDLERFSTDGLRINHKPVPVTCETQRCTAVFFAMHYGMFHLVYGVFLLTTFRIQPGIPLSGILLCILAFYINHRFSYHDNLKREIDGVPNIGTLMFFPYARILPMQLMVLLGSYIAGNHSNELVFFLLLKAATDVAMHFIEHTLTWPGGGRKTSCPVLARRDDSTGSDPVARVPRTG